MPRGSDRGAAQPSSFLILPSAAPSEASDHFTQDRQARAKEFSTRSRFWEAQAASAASLFFSAACRKASGAIQGSLRENVVGKLPTTAGWQPALPGRNYRVASARWRWPGLCSPPLEVI